MLEHFYHLWPLGQKGVNRIFDKHSGCKIIKQNVPGGLILLILTPCICTILNILVMHGNLRVGSMSMSSCIFFQTHLSNVMMERKFIMPSMIYGHRMSMIDRICILFCIYCSLITVGKQNYFTRKVTYFVTFIGCGQISMNIGIEMYNHRQEAGKVGFRSP